ncbi:MAG TPA: tetratricopeptide repeat protein [bacterium]|nr:tetratricopeptide repeat protein [bacterium]
MDNDYNKQSTPFNRLLTTLFLFVGIAAVYNGALDNPFLWDDVHLIEQNLFIQNPDNFANIFTREYFSQTAEISFRPVATMSHMLNYALWGSQPAGWHYFNLAVHLFNAMLVFNLACVALGKPWLATAVSLLFALHPIQTEALNCVTFIEDPLCLLFVMLSLSFLISTFNSTNIARRSTCLALSVISFIVAVFTKETAIAAPAIFFAYVYFVKNAKGIIPAIKLCLPYIIVAAVYLVIRFGPMKGPAESYVFHGGGAAQTFIVMIQAWAGYISIILWPAKQCVEHAFSETPGIFDASTLSALLSIVAFATCCAVIMRKEKAAGFAVAWFVFALLPVSNIIPIGVVMAERYLYIAVPGFLLAIAFALKTFLLSGDNPYPSLSRLFVSFILVISIVASGFATKNRNKAWDNEVVFWETAQSCAPISAKALVNLGVAYMNSDRLDDAKRALTLAVRIASDGSLSDQRYGSLYRAITNLGIVSAREGNLETAIKLLSASAQLNPNSEYSYFNLGVVYLRAGMPEQAEEAFKHGLTIQPHNLAARFYLIGLYHYTDRIEEAIIECDNILKLSPDNPRASMLKESLRMEASKMKGAYKN